MCRRPSTTARIGRGVTDEHPVLPQRHRRLPAWGLPRHLQAPANDRQRLVRELPHGHRRHRHRRSEPREAAEDFGAGGHECRSWRHHRILPGHTETLAVTQNISKRLTLIGEGVVAGKPAVSFVGNMPATALLTLNSVGVELRNIYFPENTQANTAE